MGSDAGLWKAQQLVNGKILNDALSSYGEIATTELPLQYTDSEGHPHSGRADTVMYTRDAEGHIKGMTIFDKKVSKAVTPHHMLQTLAYVRAAEQARRAIIDKKYGSYKEMAEANFGNDANLKKMFERFEDDPDAAETFFGALKDGSVAISGGIARIDPTTGKFELNTLPFYEGMASLTGNSADDERLLAALASNKNIEAWSEQDRGLLNKVRLRQVGRGQ